MKSRFLLTCILVIALLLRVVNLGSNPPGLHADEISFIINSVSIMETGKDEDGQTLPLLLESIKDSKPALYSYLQIPFFAVFGPTDFASRLPSALLGVLSVYLGYEFVRRLLKRQDLALLMAGILALSPWHILSSRGTQELILSFVCVQAALLLAMRLIPQWVNNDKRTFSLKGLPWPSFVGLFIFSFLAMHAYHSSKILLAAFFAGVAGFSLSTPKNFPKIKKSWLLLGIIAIAFALTASAAVTRFTMVGLFSSELPKAQIFEYTTLSTGSAPLLLLRFLYNKVTFYGLLFLQQYLSHFSLTFLFTDGGATLRQVIPSHGLFYLIEALLMGAGLYHFVANQKLRALFPYWLLFLLATPIASALTTEDVPNNVRAFSMLLPLSFLIVLGFDWILQLSQRPLRYGALALIAAGYLWGIPFFLQQYFVVMPLVDPWYRSQDYAITAQRIAELEPEYDRVIITNDLREMYIYLWREGAISIAEIQAQPLARYEESYQVGKYVFNRNQCDVSQAEGRTLVISTPGCGDLTDKGFEVLQETSYADGKPAMRLYKTSSEQ